MDDVTGATYGIEEEYHLLDPDTLALVNRPALSAEVDRGTASSRLRPEMLTSQLEAVSDVCHDLSEAAPQIAAMRAEAADAAARHHAVLLATSTHPTAGLEELEVAPRPRYTRLLDRLAGMVGRLNLTGCHVHVGVADLEVAVGVMTRARPYLPVLAALTGSSPFHDGADTGWASARLARLGLWPQGGLPPAFASADHYLDVVHQLIGTGVVDEAGELLWELRPSARFPTLEFRIADMCPDPADVVLYAGLARSLVRTLAERPATPDTEEVPESVLAAARWRAARYGLTGRLWSPRRQALAPAEQVVGELWALLEPDLERTGEDVLLRGLLARLMRRGTSATRQREVLARTGSFTEVVRDGVRVTAQEGVPRGGRPAPRR